MSHPSPTVRRALVALSALALSGSALAVTAGPASAAPADPDIVGTVVSPSGIGLAGVEVNVYTTPSNGSLPAYIGYTTTDATGHYSLNDLDPASLATVPYYSQSTYAETEFKLMFEWQPATPADYHSPGYAPRGLGGSRSLAGASSVVVPPGGTATAPSQALPLAGGVLLRILGPSGAALNDYGRGTLYEPDAYDPFEAYVESASTSGDDGFYPDGPDADVDPDAPQDGLVYIHGLEPGTSYAVQAAGSDYNPTTDAYIDYLSRFFGGDGSYTTATPVKVNAGAFTPVTVQLSDKMANLDAPRIIGDSSFGSTLTADPGTWLGGSGSSMVSRETDTDYAYQWLRGSTPVGTGPTYKVTKKDKKAKIRLAVTVYRGSYVGTAVSAPTSKVGEKSRVTVKSFAGGKVSVMVTVAKKKLAKKLGTPTGKVVLLTEDGTVASKKARLKGGQATLTVKQKYAGEKLTVVYLGSKQLGSDSAAVKGGKKKG